MFFYSFSINTILGELSIMAPSDDPSVSPISISLTCGQDVEVPTLMGVATVLIQCTPGQYNGSDPLTMQVYKDGELIPGSTSPYKIVSPTDDDFGTYTFVLSTENCGSASAVSRILCPG